MVHGCCCVGTRGWRIRLVLRVDPRPRLNLLVLEKGIRLLVALTRVILPGALGRVRVIRPGAAGAGITRVAVAAALVHPAEEAGVAAVANSVVTGGRLARWARLVRITLVVSLVLQVTDQTPGRLVQSGGHQRRVDRQRGQIQTTHRQRIRHTTPTASAVVLPGDTQSLQIRHVEIAAIPGIVPAVRAHIVARMAHVTVTLIIALHIIIDGSRRAPAAPHVRVHLIVEILIVALGLGRGIRDVYRDALDNMIFAAERLGDLGI